MIRGITIAATSALNRASATMTSIFRTPTTAAASQLLPCLNELQAFPSDDPVHRQEENGSGSDGSPSLADCLWLAVPKRKVTPGKKRMKTTVQKRIKTKNHVIVDSKTGEVTLRHRLPINWKDYIPEAK